jgi:hypothetical protein
MARNVRVQRSKKDVSGKYSTEEPLTLNTVFMTACAPCDFPIIKEDGLGTNLASLGALLFGNGKSGKHLLGSIVRGNYFLAFIV